MKRIYLHPLPLRIWHWIQVFVVIVLIGTGIYLRRHGIAGLKPHDPVLLWHGRVGYVMVLSTLFWFAYVLWSGNLRRHYGIGRKDLKGVPAQAHYYLVAIFSGGRNPFTATADAKYNPLQKLSYGAVMIVILPLLGITGLLYLDIPVVRQFLLAHDLVGPVGAVHLMCSYIVVLFLIVHLYMVTLGETVLSHTKAMITGYEEQSDGMEEDGATCGPERDA
jgi:thiosulfate reductase cytochrome b subunit